MELSRRRFFGLLGGVVAAQTVAPVIRVSGVYSPISDGLYNPTLFWLYESVAQSTFAKEIPLLKRDQRVSFTTRNGFRTPFTKAGLYANS